MDGNWATYRLYEASLVFDNTRGRGSVSVAVLSQEVILTSNWCTDDVLMIHDGQRWRWQAAHWRLDETRLQDRFYL